MMLRDMLGGKGISDEFGVALHLVKLEIVITYEGTHEECSLILRRDIADISAICSSTPVADAGLAFCRFRNMFHYSWCKN